STLLPYTTLFRSDESSLMVDPNSGQYRGAPPGPAPASTTAKKATPPRTTAAPKGVVVTVTAPSTTAATTSTSVFGPLPVPDPGKSPKSGEVALATPSSEPGRRGWAPWVAGGLLLGAGGTLLWRWRWA